MSNYLIATGYPNRVADTAWPADIHVVGKDIIRYGPVSFDEDAVLNLHEGFMPCTGQLC